MIESVREWIFAICPIIRWLFEGSPRQKDVRPSQAVSDIKTYGAHSPSVIARDQAVVNVQIVEKETARKPVECESDEERAKELIRQETADRIRKEELEIVRRKCDLAGIK